MHTAFLRMEGWAPAQEAKGATEPSKGPQETLTLSSAGGKPLSFQGLPNRRTTESWIWSKMVKEEMNLTFSVSPCVYLFCTSKSWGHFHWPRCHSGHLIMVLQLITASFLPPSLATAFLICLAPQSWHWAIKDWHCSEKGFECHPCLKILHGVSTYGTKPSSIPLSSAPLQHLTPALCCRSTSFLGWSHHMPHWTVISSFSLFPS